MQSVQAGAALQSAGALASPLKFSIAGYRHCGTGVTTLVGAYGLYWSSTFSGTNARILNIDNLANLDFSHRAREQPSVVLRIDTFTLSEVEGLISEAI